jgi:hypothetical protein
MNEEQAVLDFFAKPENLPLALIAAEHLDTVRRDLNNAFWLSMEAGLHALLAKHTLPWTCSLTEDRNAKNCLVGLSLQPTSNSRVFLRPFMEQQFTGDEYRIYHGLMWNETPDAAQKILPAVTALGETLQQAGFRQGDNFLAWQWLPWHPRRRDFLTNFGMHRETFMQEAMRPWHNLLIDLREQLQLANLALGNSPVSASITLDSLRSKLPSQTRPA